MIFMTSVMNGSLLGEFYCIVEQMPHHLVKSYRIGNNGIRLNFSFVHG